jgi:hypothetical protein
MPSYLGTADLTSTTELTSFLLKLTVLFCLYLQIKMKIENSHSWLLLMSVLHSCFTSLTFSSLCPPLPAAHTVQCPCSSSPLMSTLLPTSFNPLCPPCPWAKTSKSIQSRHPSTILQNKTYIPWNMSTLSTFVEFVFCHFLVTWCSCQAKLKICSPNTSCSCYVFSTCWVVLVYKRLCHLSCLSSPGDVYISSQVQIKSHTSVTPSCDIVACWISTQWHLHHILQLVMFPFVSFNH